MKRFSIIYLCMLLLGASLVAPVAAQDEADCPQTGGTFTIGVQSMLPMDPNTAGSDWTYYVMTNINSMLFRIESGQPVPDLAESWEISEDGTIYTWHLRQGMMWQDGNEVFPEGESREVVADDVVYSFMRQYDDESSMLPSDIRNIFVSIEAVDDYTVVLTLSAPDAIIYDKARGLTFTAIVAEEAIEYWGDEYGLHPVGSGPFEFVSYSPDEEVVLRANEDYYITPCVDEVIFKVLPDTPAAMIALEAGDIDWWGSVTPGEYVEQFQSNEDMTVINFGCPVESRNYFSVAEAPYSDVRFRQAVAVMRDGDAINQALRGSTHVHGGGTAGPGVAGYVEDLYDTYYQYDPELAASLLDEMGIVDENGDGLRDWEGETLVIPMYATNADPAPDYVAATVDAGSQIGLTIEPVITDTGTYNSTYNAGEAGIYFSSGWCGEGGTNSLWGRGGFASPLGYEDEEIFELLGAAATNLNEEERNEQLQAVTRRVAELYWAPSYGFFNIFTVKNNYVKDFFGGEWTLNLVTDDHNVWIAEDER
ncbi:ABC transporter substrate-binding protein [Phototrophicus methaneseepsis]|uniref:ABC transporter substrate-binding protein n=1 Tax=Phototrophicus methaneseepsis TaxID=2710758 RepID=A0A7S8EDF3_9CHLR|nr:ABC transporter substrate-binding protein [Phototrophicus methaneseepsis]QPC84935.1 ABC transporter substrate-binding protein [Phototrophicus methaneseepsis]